MLVFVSYSHKDAEWKDLLMPHLQVAFYGSDFEAWDDQKIRAGEGWERKILEAVDRADAAVLLVSADSLTSDYILEKEIPRLLERRRDDDLPVVPVILKPCPWQRVGWLRELEVRPKTGDISSLAAPQRDKALAAIAAELADMLTGEMPVPTPAAVPVPDAPAAAEATKAPPTFASAPRQTVQMLAELGAPVIYHNVMLNNINSMQIVVPGTVRNAQGRSAQLAVRFFAPTGQLLIANLQERFYRDMAGAVTTYSMVFSVPGDPFDLSVIQLAIPYYALNLVPTGMSMVYTLTAVGDLYVDGSSVARSQPSPLTFWW